MEFNKNKINASFNNIKIKTTSDDILKKYNLSKSSASNELPNKKSSWKIPLFSSLTTVLVTAGVIFAIVMTSNGPKNNPFRPIIIEENVSQACFEIYTGVRLLSDSLNNSVARSRKSKHEETNLKEQDFKKIVDIYHENYLTYSTLLQSKMELETTIAKGEFTIQENIYTNKMTIQGDVIFYYNFDFEKIDEDEIETSYSGVAQIDDSYFTILIEEETSTLEKEKEFEYTIFYSQTNYLKVEYGIEDKETSYEYTFYKNNKEIKAIDLELTSYKEETKLELEIFENNLSYEYENRTIGNNKNEILYEHEDFEGKIIATTTSSEVIYEESSLNYKIVKNIQ